ncbi:MAG: hypothetical protein HC860_10400 [Alkalinema sp. RU_4_3]|nr:hypothetical protein [Alkalinema sp. RU_4_3]
MGTRSIALASIAFLSLTGAVLPVKAAEDIKPTVYKEHNLTYGSFIGKAGGDTAARVVGFTQDGEILVGGNFKTTPTASQTASLLKISADGKKVLSWITLGKRIDDMEVQAKNDRLVVGGDFGVVWLQISTMKVVAQNTLPTLPDPGGSKDGTKTRVAMNPAGDTAVLRSKNVMIFDSTGTLKQNRILDGRDFVNDVAINGTGNRVYVVGYSNRRNINDRNNPVQVPFLWAMNPKQNMTCIWRSWDYNPNRLAQFDPLKPMEGIAPDAPGSECPTDPNPFHPTKPILNNMADSRLYQVVIARVNGVEQLAVLGESAGGNSVFRWDGKHLGKYYEVNSQGNEVPIETRVKPDAYSNTYNSRSAHFLYYATIRESDGIVMAGQYAVPRLPDATNPLRPGLANSFRAKDGGLALDSKGNIYVVGTAAYGILDRDFNSFNGEKVAPYKPYDLAFLMVSPDMKQRLRWTPFSRNPGGGGEFNNIALFGDRVAVVGTVDWGYMMTTPGSLAPNPLNPAKESVVNGADGLPVLDANGKETASGVPNVRDGYLGILKITP